MFILRRITADKREVNTCLNDSYHFVSKQGNEEEFLRTSEIWSETSELAEIYGFIVYNEGKDIYPLYFPSSYYIMTSDGKTFANITYK